MIKVLRIFLILLILLVSGYFIYSFLISKSSNDNSNQQITKDNFILNIEYIGNSKWEYTISGTLPNPCYGIDTKEMVMESYPEQVVIEIMLTPPDPDLMCIQVIKDIEEKGSFQASEKAQISLNILED